LNERTGNVLENKEPQSKTEGGRQKESEGSAIPAKPGGQTLAEVGPTLGAVALTAFSYERTGNVKEKKRAAPNSDNMSTLGVALCSALSSL
jgi:hypothetical protein